MDLSGAQQLQREGKLAEADCAYAELLRRSPDDARLLHSHGMLKSRRGHLNEAIDLLGRAILLSPDRADFHNNLAVVLGRAGQHQRALEILERAVRLQPTLAAAHDNVGVALDRLKQHRHAIIAFRRAAELEPDFVEAHYHLGIALRQVGQVDAAGQALRRAAELRHNDADIMRHLAAVAADQCNLKQLLALYRRILSTTGATAGDHSNLLFTLHYDYQSASQQLFDAAITWANKYAEPLTAQTKKPFTDMKPARRLRIGYVSADFREHPVGRLIEPVISGHDRKHFEVCCYSDIHAGAKDRLTHHLEARADKWRDISGISDEMAAQIIRDDKIDILVELAGHFGNNRLTMFARRPAPVQVTHFGYCSTTGMTAMDYRLTDAFSDPPGVTDRYHTEKLVRLYGSGWCYRPWDQMPQVQPPPSIKAGIITFGNLNNPIKTTDFAAAAWVAILDRVPQSRLMLLSARGAEHYIANRFKRLGIQPSRLTLIPAVPRSIYADLYNQIDVILDPFPFNGDNTTCDALWMGVPVVSLEGNSFCSRRGVSHLSNVGLTELIAPTIEDYVETASRLANDIARRIKIRRELRDRLRGSPLGDASGFVRRLEAAYRSFWVNLCDQSDCR